MVTATKDRAHHSRVISKLKAIHEHVTSSHHDVAAGVGGKLPRNGECLCFGVSVLIITRSNRGNFHEPGKEKYAY